MSSYTRSLLPETSALSICPSPSLPLHGYAVHKPSRYCFYGLILTDILLFINSRFCLENAGEEEKRQFLQEIDLMKDVGSHRNILSILGFWIRSEPIMLIMEYVPHGDLLKWLRNKRQQIKIVAVCIDFLPFSH